MATIATDSSPIPGSPDGPARFARYWAPRMLLLNLFAYPVVGVLASLLDFDSRIAAIPMRVVVLLISLYVIAGTYQNGRWLAKNTWLMAFALLYLARLLYDWLVAGMPKVTEALTFYVVVCLIPGIASGMAGIVALGEKRVSWYIGLVGGGICALIVVMWMFGYGSARTHDMIYTGGRLYFEALNPIAIGHIGASTLIALLSLTRTRMPMANFVVLLVLAAAALGAMLAAGSRGPILAMACAGLVYAIATARFGWILLIIGAGAVLVFYGENSLLQRFEGAATDESSLERLAIQGSAILQFLGSPILGSAYAELVSMEYPHNLFIETAMALGLVGLSLLLIVLFRTTRLAWRSLREGRTLIPLLFVQYFVGWQFSGSLWSATASWVTLMILGSYPYLRRSRRVIEERRPSPPLTATG